MGELLLGMNLATFFAAQPIETGAKYHNLRKFTRLCNNFGDHPEKL